MSVQHKHVEFKINTTGQEDVIKRVGKWKNEKTRYSKSMHKDSNKE